MNCPKCEASVVIKKSLRVSKADPVECNECGLEFAPDDRPTRLLK